MLERNTEKEETTEKAITELQRMFDHVSNIYDQLRVKALGVLAGEVALVTFIFTGSGVGVPEQPYGIIFFTVGILCLLAAFGLLLWTLSPLQWKVPYDAFLSKRLHSKFKTKQAFLDYLNDDYVDAVTHCFKYVGRRAQRFSWTIYLLLAGAIIVMVIKYGGQS